MSGHVVTIRLTRQQAIELLEVLETIGYSLEGHDEMIEQFQTMLEVPEHPEIPAHIHPGQTRVEDFADSIPVDEIHDHIDPEVGRHGRDRRSGGSGS